MFSLIADLDNTAAIRAEHLDNTAAMLRDLGLIGDLDNTAAMLGDLGLVDAANLCTDVAIRAEQGIASEEEVIEAIASFSRMVAEAEEKDMVAEAEAEEIHMQQFNFFVKYDDEPIAYGFHTAKEAEAFCVEGTHVVYDDVHPAARTMLNCLAQITDDMQWWTAEEVVSRGGEIHKGYHQDYATTTVSGEWLACVDVGYGPVFMRQADLNRLADAHNQIVASVKFLSLMNEVHHEVMRFLKGARV